MKTDKKVVTHLLHLRSKRSGQTVVVPVVELNEGNIMVAFKKRQFPAFIQMISSIVDVQEMKVTPEQGDNNV